MDKKIGYVIVHFVDGSKLKISNKITNQASEDMIKSHILLCDDKAIFLDKVMYFEFVNVPERYAIRNCFKKMGDK